MDDRGLHGESLEALRKRLDEINIQLLKWLNERAAVVEKIGQLKEKQSVQRYDPVREAEMLAKLVEMNEGPFDDATIQHLFKEIFKASLNLQKDDSKEGLLVSRKRKPTNTHVPIGDLMLGNRMNRPWWPAPVRSRPRNRCGPWPRRWCATG